MSTNIFLLYSVTWLLVALTPGPAVICSMAQAARWGFRSSLAGIAGIQTGNLFFFICVGLGLGTFLAPGGRAFALVRLLGAIYLFYLGMRIIFATCRPPSSKAAPSVLPPVSRHSLFLQGLLIQLTNPKALLFVSALLPQFIEPQRSVPVQMTVLAITTIGLDAAVLSTYAFFAQKGTQSFRGSRAVAWLERVFGAALVGFGCRLLLSRE